jgi:hypothetical protein
MQCKRPMGEEKISMGECRLVVLATRPAPGTQARVGRGEWRPVSVQLGGPHLCSLAVLIGAAWRSSSVQLGGPHRCSLAVVICAAIESSR